MIDLASLVVRLVVDARRFTGDLDSARERLSSFAASAAGIAKKVATVAAAATAGAAIGFIAMAKSAIDAADNLNDLSKSTGISTESLSQLQYAAEQSGTSLDGLVIGLRKFSSSAADAAAKAGPARESFELIGVSVTDSNGKLKATDQLLLDVAEKFAGFKDGAGKAALAADLFGKSGAELIPFLNEGRSGIVALQQEADRLGLTLQTKTAKQADDFNDTLGKLTKTLQGQVLQGVTLLLPKLLELAQAFLRLAQSGAITKFLDGLGDIFVFVTANAARLVTWVSNLGRQIGALGAIAAQAALGHFKEAKAIYLMNQQDQIAAEENLTVLLAALYDRRAGILAAKSEQTAPVFDTPKTDVPIPKKVTDRLQEVEIKLKKIDIPDDVYGDLERETRTSTQNIYAEFNLLKGKLDLIFKDIGAADYTARLQEGYDRLRESLANNAKVAVEKTVELNEFQLQAARNTQDIIADTFQGLATGADVSAKSILKSFGAMIIQLAAQAAAANLAGKLFGEAAGGAAGSTGWVGLAMTALGAATKRDSGGRGRAGMAYAIGTGAQPERFIPDRSGTFIPAGAGGVAVTNNFNFTGDAPVSRRTQLQIAATVSRGVERANRRNN